MWLIDVDSLVLKSFWDPVPVQYAILSHTWVDGEEVSFQEFADPNVREKKASFDKIQQTCHKAKALGLQYAWVDTCCIDKSSSAELTEAINSMFAWYKRASVCFAFLADLVPSGPDDLDGAPKNLGDCKWFYRGWTLQELIAPEHLIFFDKAWNRLSTKKEWKRSLERLTGIQGYILCHPNHFNKRCVAQRMSWASRRKTTRIEDEAYCLMGLFEVNMPLLYGEGKKAFTRLQEEILKKSEELTLFAWRSKDDSVPVGGLLASSPADFVDSGSCLIMEGHGYKGEIAITNRGIRLDARLYPWDRKYAMFLFAMDDQNGHLSSIFIYIVRDEDRWLRCLLNLFAEPNCGWQDEEPLPITIKSTFDLPDRHPYWNPELFQSLLPGLTGFDVTFSCTSPKIQIGHLEASPRRE